MQVSHLRALLLTGASVATMGLLATGAEAQVVPGICSPNPPAPNVTNTIDITLLGHTGVTDNSNPAVAVVTGCTTGEIEQGGSATGVAPPNGDVNLLITNGAAGDVAVLANANAVNAVGDASAFASIFNNGIGQIAAGAGDLNIAIDNKGSFAAWRLANSA